MKHWSFRRVLAVLVAGNLLLGGVLFTVGTPAQRTDETTPPPALPAAVQELQEKIAAGRHGEPYALALSDEELTSVVEYVLARSPNIPLTRVTITLTDGKVIADGVTRGLAVALPVRVTGTVGARDGRPWAQVQDVRLGEAPLPAFIRTQVLQELNASFDLARYPLPVTVEALELRPGEIRLQGTIK
ncbi:MAG: LmeA family phospholipid-binding protein [Chloroflexi bacterium]|nr:LmeA family phospholipid-binding protein [Chloroflexota bacterium]